MPKKSRPIPRRQRMNTALNTLKRMNVSVEDVMACWLIYFEMREVTRHTGEDVSEWLTRVQADEDYPRTLGNDIFDRAIEMAARYRL